MRRDMDLVRQLLVVLEDAEDTVPLEQVLPENPNRRLVAYHLWLLMDAGLIDGSCQRAMDGTDFCLVNRLTWQGHEFLATARDDSVWKEAKERLGGRIGDVGFQVVSDLLTALLTSKLGIGR